MSPLPWDVVNDKKEVANAVLFMLGMYSKKITGQTIYVDGGANNIGGALLPYEKPLMRTPAKVAAKKKAEAKK
jgi:enoyl-[acyl-carrier-protein] reductase (NADH)